MKRHLVVNGARHELEIAPDERLLAVLRERLGLTGAKEGCGVGECGACTVLIGGRARQACLTLAATVDEEVRTVEGLADDDRRLAQAFAEHGGFQCGFCTPGQLMRARALTEQQGAPGDTPSDTWIRAEMTGNVCRCTGYAGIIRAVRAAMTEDTP